MIEEWRDIEGYEGLYQVSNTGKARSLSHRARNNINDGFRLVEGRELKPYKNHAGYLQITLSKGKSHKRKRYLHVLVAAAFLENPDNLSEINHKDGVKAHNSVDNLEYITHQDNCIHAVENGLNSKAHPVMNTKTGVKYRSLTEAGRKNGLNHKAIKYRCDIGYGWRLLKKGDT